MTARTVPAGTKIVCDIDLGYDAATHCRSDVVTFEDASPFVRFLNRDANSLGRGFFYFSVDGSLPVPDAAGTYRVRPALHSELVVACEPGPVVVTISNHASYEVPPGGTLAEWWPTGAGDAWRYAVMLVPSLDVEEWPELPAVPPRPES